jgi:hypothetical protein
MDHRLAPQTCCELIDVIIKRNPYMHPIGQNRGPFAFSIVIGPAAISITDDDCVVSILILTRRKRGLISLRPNQAVTAKRRRRGAARVSQRRLAALRRGSG